VVGSVDGTVADVCPVVVIEVEADGTEVGCRPVVTVGVGEPPPHPDPTRSSTERRSTESMDTVEAL
nr:hypothetical protein [Clostridia bacterium]